MASKILGICLMLMCVYSVEAYQNGICRKTVLVKVSMTTIEWKFKDFKRPRCFFNCIRKTQVSSRGWKNKTKPKTISECCVGYLQNGTVNADPICIPQCDPLCQHGACVEPNICECVPGYEFKDRMCHPVCSELCNNGTCVEPETCKCFTGYRMTDVNVCSPVCSKGCTNGSCISPEICQCENGWQLINGTACVPKCEPPCGYGICTAPNTCKCDDGFQFNGTCQPVCSDPCHNGICVRPDTCKCFSRYRKTNVNVCSPVCSKGCTNGSCISPEVCQCDDGWELINGTSCVPKCEPPCRNGICTAPNTCKCDDGFQFNGTCQPVCSDPCHNGTCVRPDTCECLSGYKKNDANVCTPFSSYGCDNSSCISRCDVGYILTNGICEPVCFPPCENSHCIAPENCKCDPGYELFATNLMTSCEPICFPLCKNGICVAPNNCTCDPGYVMKHGTCEPVCLTCNNGINVSKLSIPWVDFVIPIVALLIIATAIILIWKRHSISGLCKRTEGSYNVAGDKKEPHQNSIPDIRFSAIMKRKTNSEETHIENECKTIK